MKQPFIVALIPAYNEERTIAKVVLKTKKYVDKVIVCDDGSTDMTGEIARALGAEVIRHERNMGYGAALISLFKHARELNPDVVVTLDADGQHNPEDIPRLVEPILRGDADIVIGSRFLGGTEMPKYREIGVKAITRLVRMAGYEELTDAQSGFRAYSRRALQLIHPTEQGMGISTEILVKANEEKLKILEVPVKIEYSVERPSKRNPIYHAIVVVLSTVKFMSMRHPLLFYGVPGVLALLVAGFFWLWSLQILATYRQLVTNIVLIAIGATTVGLILTTTAMILWVLVSILRERY